MSQKADILEHLKQGHSISRLQALREFGCFELSARICELENEGCEITTVFEDIAKANGERKRVAVYSLLFGPKGPRENTGSRTSPGGKAAVKDLFPDTVENDWIEKSYR